MPENIMDHIDAEGKFGEGFKSAAISIAGEDHKDTKVYDDVLDFNTLVKNYADTKSLVGKKLEGVIQIPKDDASDEDKSTFRSDLLTRLGASDKPEDYVLPKAEELEYDENAAKMFQALAVENKIPVDIFNKLAEGYTQMQVQQVKDCLATQQAQSETEFAQLNKDWPGDSMVENGRTVFAALMEFGDEGLQKLVKDAKINDDPGNHQKWLELGFNAQQRRIWCNIGTKMKSAEHLEGAGEGEGEGAGNEGGNKGGSDLVGPGKMYDHPTSKELAR